MLSANQFKAAYILKDVKNYIDGKEVSKEERKRLYDIFDFASYFDVVSNFNMDEEAKGAPEYAKNIAKVAQNIVQRGFPTLAPFILEEIGYSLEGLDERCIRESLIIHEPKFRFIQKFNYLEKTDNGEVKKAQINNTEVELISSVSPLAAQLMEMQKPVEEVINYPNTDIKRYEDYARYFMNYAKAKIVSSFYGQRFDFTMTLPGEHCLNIEFDGPTHNDPEQKELDRKRNQLLTSMKWYDTLRVTDLEDERIKLKTDKILTAAFGDIGDELCSLDVIVKPILMARITKTFLYLVEQGYIRVFSKEPVYLCVETRENIDVFNMAFRHCLELLYNLLSLTSKDKLQIADVCVRYKDGTKIRDCRITSKEIKFNAVHKNFASRAYIVIKDQMKRRYCFMDLDGYAEHSNHKTIWLLSSYGQWSCYKLRTSDKCIKYDIKDNDEPILQYFLLNIFGKPKFRPKQFEIIQSALNGKNVIGLLPTGSGKSITFQLSAMLQPMVSIVVAPLVSLMEDQVHNLKMSGITNVASINSTKTIDEKIEFLKKFGNNQIGITYISPERLQIRLFREAIRSLNVGYVVLDEAHCVSQWGHDFRTAYLRVGDTVKKYAPDAVMMALTGTASSNVITDIKRELHMSNKVAIIATEDFRRDELHFRIINKKENSSLQDTIKEGYINEAVKSALKELCKEQSCKLKQYMSPTQNGYENSGVIFNPFAEKSNESIYAIIKQLKEVEQFKGIEVGIYHGQLNSAQKSTAQGNFVDNKTFMLVSTKAFGMGIDKPNIRFTVHTCVPESIESFYQEAGRAGRDGKYAVNIIVAPPGETRYEDSADKAVYDYFIGQSFPDIVKLKEAMRLLLSKKIMYIKSQATVLLEDMTIDGKLPTDAKLVLEQKSQNVEFSLCNKKGLKFAVSVDPDEKKAHIECVNKNAYESTVHNNIILDYYVNSMLDRLQEKLDAAEFKDTEELKKYVDTCVNEYRANIVDCVKKSSKGNPVDCYIRIGFSTYSNPVDSLFEELFATTHILKHELNLTAAEQSAFTKSRDNIEIVIKNEDLTEEQKYNKINQWFDRLEQFYYSMLTNNNLPDTLKVLFSDVKNKIGRELIRYVRDAEPAIDVDKLLYYLGILGIYSSFERDYGQNVIRITVEPVTKESLLKHIKVHLSGYETTDYVDRIIKKLDIFDNIADDDIGNLIIAATDYIIDYSYTKILEYRMKQTENMYTCVQAKTVEGPEAFVKSVYQYFEAKYYAELFKDVDKNEKVNTAIKWIEKVEEVEKEDLNNSGETYLNNLSHLRSSAMKCMAARPDAYTPYFLITYCTLRDPNLYIKEGLDKFLEGLAKLKGLRTSYTSLIKQIAAKSLDTNDKRYLEEVYKFINDYKGKNRSDLQEFADVITAKLNEGYGLFSSEDLEEEA